MQEVNEVLRPEVGRYYLVPHLQQIRKRSNKEPSIVWVPVHGPKHTDAEIIGFPWPHYHLDPRFASDAFLWRYLGPYNSQRYRNGKSLAQQGMVVPVIVSGHPEMYKVFSAEPILRKRLCVREMPNFPTEAKFGWQPKLEKSYFFCRLDAENPVCPHQGFKLSGLPVRGGVVTCPGHGLRWDLKTGYQSSEVGVARW